MSHKPVNVLGRVVVCDWIAHRGCGKPLMAIRDAGDRKEHMMCPGCGAFLCCDDERWLNAA